MDTHIQFSNIKITTPTSPLGRNYWVYRR